MHISKNIRVSHVAQNIYMMTLEGTRLTAFKKKYTKVTCTSAGIIPVCIRGTEMKVLGRDPQLCFLISRGHVQVALYDC